MHGLGNKGLQADQLLSQMKLFLGDLPKASCCYYQLSDGLRGILQDQKMFGINFRIRHDHQAYGGHHQTIFVSNGNSRFGADGYQLSSGADDGIVLVDHHGLFSVTARWNAGLLRLQAMQLIGRS